MAVEVIMPKAGSEMEEGEIVQWFKQEGEEVKEGEVLLEIVTDKVNMEVEAEASGTLLKILHPADQLYQLFKQLLGLDNLVKQYQELMVQQQQLKKLLKK